GPDREPSLLAARERERIRRSEMRETKPLEEQARAVARLLGGASGAPRSDNELLVHPAGDELMLGILEDRADARHEPARGHAPRVVASKTGLAAQRPQESRDHEPEPPLARPVRAHRRAACTLTSRQP